MLLLLLSVLLCAGQGTLAKKGKAETIDSNFQPGEGGIAERTGQQDINSVQNTQLMFLGL